jgi:DNA phosphorothioation-dependent restriction protein DptG
MFWYDTTEVENWLNISTPEQLVVQIQKTLEVLLGCMQVRACIC